MINRGYIKIYRSLEEWEWADNPVMVYFWVRILLMANWEEKRWHNETIERGSFVTSVSSLSQTLKLSVQQVRTCLAHLKDNNQITCNSTNKATKITICKYEDYQDIQQAIEQSEIEISNNQTTTTKEYKEERKNIKKRLSKDNLKESLVYPYSSDKFMQTWDALIQQPMWKKKTIHALQLNLKDLGKYAEPFAIMLMEETIKHGWQGVVFENTPTKYDAWLKEHPQEELPKEESLLPFTEKGWKQDHYLYDYEDFMENDPYEFDLLLPEMQADLKAGKKMLCKKGLWEWPDENPNYEIFN